MAVALNNNAIYVKGTAEMWVHDFASGDLIGHSNKIDTSNFTSSVNAGEIRAGLGAPIVFQIPDSSTFTGEVTSADFSLEARQLITGGKLSYNGTAPIMEKITATTTTLTVSRTPVAAYGEPSSNETYSCYVGNDGINYGVNPSTKEIQNFTAEVGKTYCVTYYSELASARELTIPSAFSPTVARVTVKMAVYGAQGKEAMNGSRIGYLFIYIPQASFASGDFGVNGSQTETANTSWSFQAMAYDEADETCSVCANDNSVFGYMVYVPCGTNAEMSAVKGLAVVGGVVSVAENETVQIPVKYIMDDNSLINPRYADLTFVSAATATATVNEEGVITGVAAGSTTVTVSTKALKPNTTDEPLYTATANVTVTV